MRVPIVALYMLLASADAFCGPCDAWAGFELQVRDQTIANDSAKALFPAIYTSLRQYCTGFTFATAQWTFPLEGHTCGDAGKGGFRPDILYGGSPVKGYNFYDGNRHGGHPAYDIFIHDANRDCKDDRNGLPVYVVAPADMLILSTDITWEKGSAVRGGKYVWTLIPQAEMLLYFAHLDSIAVSGGAIVRSGTRIATVGRSGKNAALTTSATHLHMMALQVSGSELKPVDFLQRFIKRNPDRSPAAIGAGDTSIRH